MDELLQFRIPKGKKDNISLYYFFTLHVELLLLFRAQKQRKAWVEKGPLELLVQTSVRSQGHRLGYSEICQAESFKIFSDRNFTSVLGNLFQCLIITGCIFFSYSQTAFPLSNLYMLPLVLSLCILVKRASPPSLYLCFRCFIKGVVRSPLSLVFPRLNTVHSAFLHMSGSPAV